MPNRYTGYELFGFDVILDDTLKPWLLEVNISPSLHSNSPLDLAVKGPLIAEVFNIVGYHLPPHLPASLSGQVDSQFQVMPLQNLQRFDQASTTPMFILLQKTMPNQTEKDISRAKFNILLYANSLSKNAKRKHVDFRVNFDDRTEVIIKLFLRMR